MNKLSDRPARPRPRRRAPTYPRLLLAAGLAVSVAGCGGANPAPDAPSSVVVVQQPPPTASTGYAQPPPGDPPPPDDPRGRPLAGVAPQPFEEP